MIRREQFAIRRRYESEARIRSLQVSFRRRARFADQAARVIHHEIRNKTRNQDYRFDVCSLEAAHVFGMPDRNPLFTPQINTNAAKHAIPAGFHLSIK